MGAWGLGLFQSDHELDLVSKLSTEAGLERLQEQAREKAKEAKTKIHAGRSKKQRAKAQKAQKEAEENDEFVGIYFTIYGGSCFDIPTVRKHLDNGVLQTMINNYTTKFRGPQPKNNDELYSPAYVLVMLGACAMSMGCKVSADFKVLLKRLYNHVNLMPLALKQCTKALTDGEYIEGHPYDFGSLGLDDTADQASQNPRPANPSGVTMLNMNGKGCLFEPLVPAPEFPDGVCGGCGAGVGEGEGEGGTLLSCGTCKKKYCSKDCQKVTWPAHKKECKAIE